MMKGSDVLRLVEQMHNDKNIPREIIFEGLEAAIQLAAEKKYGEESGVVVAIDRESGDIAAKHGEESIDPSEFPPLSPITRSCAWRARGSSPYCSTSSRTPSRSPRRSRKSSTTPK